jgi:hypothetical protein
MDKSKKPVILSVTHHYRGPFGSTYVNYLPSISNSTVPVFFDNLPENLSLHTTFKTMGTE